MNSDGNRKSKEYQIKKVLLALSQSCNYYFCMVLHPPVKLLLNSVFCRILVEIQSFLLGIKVSHMDLCLYLNVCLCYEKRQLVILVLPSAADAGEE